jgi:hypothetical protein
VGTERGPTCDGVTLKARFQIGYSVRPAGAVRQLDLQLPFFRLRDLRDPHVVAHEEEVVGREEGVQVLAWRFRIARARSELLELLISSGIICEGVCGRARRDLAVHEIVWVDLSERDHGSRTLKTHTLPIFMLSSSSSTSGRR